MDVLRAAYLVAHGFKPDGAVGLAKVMGIPAGTLSNEVNPEQETHKLGLGRAVAMTVASGDFTILHAFADTCGHLAFPKPDLSNVSDSALLDLFMARDEAAGAFAQAVAAALADGQISHKEFSRIKERAYRHAASVLEIVARLEGLIDAR